MASSCHRRQLLSLFARYNDKPSTLRPMIRAASSSTVEPNIQDDRGRSLKTGASTSASTIYADEWVPAAYRGAQKSSSFEESHATARDGFDRRNRRSSGRRRKLSLSRLPLRKHPYNREQDKLQKEITKRQDRHDELLEHWSQNVKRLAKNYQTSLSRRQPPETYGSKRSKSKSKHALNLDRLSLELKQMFESVHATDSVNLRDLAATEDLYRGICRALQQAIELSLGLASASTVGGKIASVDGSRHVHYHVEEAAAYRYVELAELALLTLAKFQSERSSLVENAILSNDMHNSRSNDGSQGPSTATKGGLFQSLVAYFVGDTADSLNERSVMVQPMAHEDPTLGVTVELLSSVLRAMYGLVVETPPEEVPAFAILMTESQQQQDQAKYQAMAERMNALLETMPASWQPSDAGTLELVLDVQCRIGTLESARACMVTYQRWSNAKYQLRFALVLQAYLGAVMHETDDEIRLLAAKESTSVLHGQWTKSSPRHRVERVLHASIVLNCIAVADRARASGTASGTGASMRELADGVIKRAIGGKKSYAILLKELESPNPSFDYLSLPLVNYLTHIYANSGGSNRLVTAKKALGTIISNDRVGVGRMIVFPVVETANAVLRAITRQYENRAKADWKDLTPEQDLAYAVNLVDDLLDRRETTSWPNADTFETVFRLLLALKPTDVGEQAERLLTRMELRNILSPTTPLSISLSTYHRVLRCWMEAAKVGTGHEACDRALAILDKLDAQSTPLLLSDEELRLPIASPLYNILLRPTRQTYKLVLNICLETRNDDGLEGALRVANEVYARMERNGFVPDKESAKRLATCRNRTKQPGAKMTTMISSETMDMITKPQASL